MTNYKITENIIFVCHNFILPDQNIFAIYNGNAVGKKIRVLGFGLCDFKFNNPNSKSA